MDHFTIITHELNLLYLTISNPDDKESEYGDLTTYNKFVGYIHQESTKPLWKSFEVPLLDKNCEQRYNENGKPITVTIPYPKTLHSTVFLTNSDKHREIKRAWVVEMIGDYKKILDNDKDREVVDLRNLF